MNAVPLQRHLALAFGRPFRAGWKHMLFSLLFLLLPCTAFIARGAAYSFAAGRQEGVGGWAKLGFKILIAQLLLAAPALFFYALAMVFGARYASMPVWFQLLLTAGLVVSAVRLVVLFPISACCLALGAPLRTAICAREMKSIVSLSLGRYLLSALLSVILLAVIALLSSLLPLLPLYFVSAVLVTLWQFFSAGLFLGCCRHALGLAPPEDGGVYPPPRSVRAVAGLLIFALLLSALPAPALAAPSKYDGDSQPVRPADGAAGAGEASAGTPTDYLEAYRYFSARGELHPGERIGFDGSNGKYYVMSEEAARNEDRLGNAIIQTADVASDFIPGVSNIKSVLQANYYYHQIDKTDDPELKKEYTALATYKTAGVLLGGLGSGLKALNGAAKTSKFARYVRINWFNGAQRLQKDIETVDKITDGMQYYDNATNVLSYVDIFYDTEYASLPGIGRLINDIGKGFFEPYDEPQNVMITFDPAGMPSGYTAPVSDGTAQLTPDSAALPDITLPSPLPSPGWNLGSLIDPVETPVPTPAPTSKPKPAPTPTPKPAEAPLSVGAFMGTWVNADGERMILMASGSNVIEKEPDLSWYGGDVVCTEYRAEYDESTRTLRLSGMTSWVVGPELLDATTYTERPLEINASSLSMELTAVEVRDGVITKLNGDVGMLTRSN